MHFIKNEFDNDPYVLAKEYLHLEKKRIRDSGEFLKWIDKI